MPYQLANKYNDKLSKHCLARIPVLQVLFSFVDETLDELMI